jgi:predicted  nucleic acid-binding Zn-ribbon protein
VVDSAAQTADTLVSTRTESAAWIREQSINFSIAGFLPGEVVSDIFIDGIQLPVLSDIAHYAPDTFPIDSLTADANGEVSGLFWVPANTVSAGAKGVGVLGGFGSTASATFVARGTMTVNELRRTTFLVDTENVNVTIGTDEDRINATLASIRTEIANNRDSTNAQLSTLRGQVSLLSGDLQAVTLRVATLEDAAAQARVELASLNDAALIAAAERAGMSDALIEAAIERGELLDAAAQAAGERQWLFEMMANAAAEQAWNAHLDNDNDKRLSTGFNNEGNLRAVITAQKAHYTARRTQLDSSEDTLRETVRSEMVASRNNANTKLTALRSSLSTAVGDASDLQSIKTRANSTLDNLSLTLASLDQQLSVVDAALATISSQISGLSAAVDGNITEPEIIAAVMDALSRLLAALRDDLALNASVHGLTESAYNALEGSVISLQDLLLEARAITMALEPEASVDLAAKIADAENRLNAMGGLSLIDLSAEMAALRDAISDIDTQLSDHEERITALELQPQTIVNNFITQWIDPLAQTFVLERSLQCAGFDVWFTAKHASEPVLVQIRTVEMGMPTQNVVGQVYVPAASIAVDAWSRIAFTTPVWLEAGQSYALTLLCDNAVSACAIARLGEFDRAGLEIVAAQPYQVGVLLSSSNASTWTAHQDADLAFRLVEHKLAGDPSQTVEVGAVDVVDCDHIVIYAAVERPTQNAEAIFTLTLPNGEKLLAQEGWPVTLPNKVTGVITVQAELSGSDATPILHPQIVIAAGERALTALYQSRAFAPSAQATRGVVSFEALLPSGSAVNAEVWDGSQWHSTEFLSAVQVGDGWISARYEKTGLTVPLEAKVRLTLTGHAHAVPKVRKIHAVLT